MIELLLPLLLLLLLLLRLASFMQFLEARATLQL